MKKLISVFLCITVIFGIFLTTDAFAQSSQSPKIIHTVYPVDDAVIADIVATESPYYLDNTGRNDCTSALQKAIDDCAANGGGTVFLPVGKYRLTGSIAIRPFVTLQGDWQDPDIGTDYGTVIIADVESIDSVNPALFNIGGSAGAVGLTVWYPNQSIDNIKPYPYTFYVDGKGSNYMLQTLKNCTLINSYSGIGGCAECANGIYECHEMFSIENVKGTCLFRGLTSYNSADVDTIKTFIINGKYWSEADNSYNAPALEAITDYTRKNLIAMSLGDLEWPEMADIHISDCFYGIRMEKGARYSFSGTFYDLYIENCDYGIYCPEGTVTERDKQYGMAICNGKIMGSELAVYNQGDNCIMLTNVEVDGKTKGKNIYKENASTDRYELDYNHTHAKVSDNLYIVNADKTGKADASASVQNTLNEAAVTGGIVYMPAGVYRFENAITIPSGVELRGSSSVPNRCQGGNSSGTLILSYFGYLDENPSAVPLISIVGDNAGISGIRITYYRNNPVDDSGKFIETSPAIKASGSHIYVINSFVILASKGIVAENCNDVYLKKNVGCCFDSFINSYNSTDVFIEGCLQNGNTVPRNGFSSLGIADLDGWLNEANIFNYLFDPLTRKHTDYITLTDSDNVTIFNTFIYGGRSYLVSENSSAFICNVGCDGNAKNSYFYSMQGGEITLINAMRSTSNGKDGFYSHTTDGKTKLKIYNRLPVDMKYREYTVFENVALDELEECDRKTYFLQPFYHLYEAMGKLFMKLF